MSGNTVPRTAIVEYGPGTTIGEVIDKVAELTAGGFTVTMRRNLTATKITVTTAGSTDPTG